MQILGLKLLKCANFLHEEYNLDGQIHQKLRRIVYLQLMNQLNCDY